MKTEVIIIGKGIAGLAMSFLLAKKQIPHLVLGRREKLPMQALGETLPPSALLFLQSCGLLGFFESCAIRKTTGYHSCWGSDRVTDHNFYFNRPFQHGLKLNKQRLIRELEQLQASYVRYFDNKLLVDEEPDQYVVTLDDGKQVRARYLVDATGRKRFLHKALGLEQQEYDSLMAFSCHIPKVKLDRLPHGVFSETFAQGWGIVTELSETHNVMSLYTTRSCEELAGFKDFRYWSEILRDTQYLKDYLPQDTDYKVVGGKANTSRSVDCAGTNWLAIGDAAMAFDPLSSHGITSGIYTAQQAVSAIEADKPIRDGKALLRYGKRLNAIFEGYMEQKQKLYSAETRWQNELFWQEMQGESVVDSTVLA